MAIVLVFRKRARAMAWWQYDMMAISTERSERRSDVPRWRRYRDAVCHAAVHSQFTSDAPARLRGRRHRIDELLLAGSGRPQVAAQLACISDSGC